MFTSFFRTIQGEGASTGRNVMFVRLFTEHCFPNKKRCSFCDTVGQPYWRENHNLEEFYGLVKTTDCKHFVITGGEPLQPESYKDLLIMACMLSDFEKTYEIETNGAFLNKLEDDTVIRRATHINISPKMKNSHVGFDYDRRNEVYHNEKLKWKFVLDPKNLKESWQEVEQWIVDARLDETNIWIMCQTPATQEEKKSIFNLAIEKGVNYSPRLHIDLFGDIEEEI